MSLKMPPSKPSGKGQKVMLVPHSTLLYSASSKLIYSVIPELRPFDNQCARNIVFFRSTFARLS